MDVVFPPGCVACRVPVAADGNFCPACFAKLRMIAAPLCDCCGVPFAVAIGDGAQCPECLASPPEFTHARAALVYDAISAPLVTALKFHDQWAGLTRAVDMMMGAAGDLAGGADLLVPVPLHWRRLMKRKYNQSALLAYEISSRVNLPVMPQLLARIRPTTPQMRLDRKTRLTNMHKAFASPPAATATLKGKCVLLVDDVVTTGATANACARALKRAGAREVRVLALARTVRE